MIDPHCDYTSESRQVFLAAIRHRAHWVEVFFRYVAFTVRLQEVTDKTAPRLQPSWILCHRHPRSHLLGGFKSTATAVLTTSQQTAALRQRTHKTITRTFLSSKTVASH